MKSKRLHYLQHVAYEGLGYIGDWAVLNGFELTSTEFYQEHTLPSTTDFDWLVVMGGPMGVYDEEKYPWLITEKQLINKAIDENKVVIGICLGSQLIAESLGAKVFPNEYKEIGWMPISIKPTALFNFQTNLTVFHWHGDTYNLPLNCELLASTSVCPHQAFIYNKKVVGIQFHIEVSPASVKEMVLYGKDELVEAPYIQDTTSILSNMDFFETNKEVLFHLLDTLHGEKL